MLFTSPLFLFAFLPVFFLAYYVVQDLRARNFIALAGSVFFFAWGEPVFVFALFVGTFVDYYVSLVVAPDSKHIALTKRIVLRCAIALNIALLIASKYTDFIIVEFFNRIGSIINIQILPPHIPLLLGISFITFHRISYLVDSYKGRAIPPRGFFDCALYIFLFPQLIAGPIIRYHDIGYQIHSRRHTIEGFLTGFNRFGIGLVKKLLLADPLGTLADTIFGYTADSLSCNYAWGGIIAYTLQIYFDFSGYSDMAIGLGRMMGFRFPENFNRPYISQSVTEFWRRWHISLSNWMRLYLYIPLGGNRVSVPRMYLNLWVVFLISGFWHGASWNFIAWGAYYGFFLSVERALSGSRIPKVLIPSWIKQTCTLLIVAIGWVFFRSPSFEYATQYIGVMFDHDAGGAANLPPWGIIFGNREIVTMVFSLVIACVRIPEFKKWCPSALSAAYSEAMTIDGVLALTLQFIFTLIFCIVSAAAVVSADYVPFLYFRF